MATKDGRAQIWYADSSGNVTGYTESVGEIAGTIIDAYNEHFGTDISIWTPETKTLQVGGTVPNWNAYEKIEMEQIKVAIDAGSAQYIFGYVKGSECSISVTSSNHCNVCNNEGEITYPQGGPSLDDNIKNMIRYKLSAYNVENITSMIESYEQDQVIDNWDEYTIIQ